jgi:hypothetical protein
MQAGPGLRLAIRMARTQAQTTRTFCLGLSEERSVATDARASGESSGGAISTMPEERPATSTSS